MERFFARTKRAFAGILALIVMFTSLPAMTFADETETVSDTEEVAYSVDSDPYAVIIGNGVKDAGTTGVVSAFTYEEMSVSDNGTWVSVGGQHRVDVSANSYERVDIMPDDIVKISNLEYSDPVSVVDRIVYCYTDHDYDNGTSEPVFIDITANDAGEFVSPKITTVGGFDLSVKAKTLPVENVVIDEAQQHLDEDNPITIDESCITEIAGKKYINRADLYFSVNPQNGYEINEVIYSVKNKDGEPVDYFASFDTEKELYVISADYVTAGILGGEITIKATFKDQPPVTVVFDQATGKNRNDEDEKVLTSINTNLALDSISGNEYVFSDGIVSFSYGYAEGLSAHEVKLGVPTATIGTGEDAIPIDVSYNETDRGYDCFLYEEDVIKAIANKEKIYVNDNAEAIPLSNVKLSLTGDIQKLFWHVKSIKLSEVKKDENGEDVVVKTYDFSTGESWWTSWKASTVISVQTGNSLRFDDFGYEYENMEKSVFVAIKCNDFIPTTFFTFKGDTPFSRVIDADRELTVIFGAIFWDEYESKTVALKDEPDISPNELPISVPTNGQAALTSCLAHNKQNNVEIELSISNLYQYDALHTYAFTGKFKYYIGSSEYEVSEDEVINYNDWKATITVPYGLLAMAAISESSPKITFVADVKATGYNDREICVIQGDDDFATTRIKSAGKLLYNEYMNQHNPDLENWDSVYAKYGKDAVIMVKPKEGYELNASYLISKKNYDKVTSQFNSEEELFAWLGSASADEKSTYDIKEYTPNANGNVQFTIDKVEANYYVINAVTPQVFAKVDETRVDKSGSFNVLYNDDVAIRVYQGNSSVKIGDSSQWTVRAFKENARTKVFDKIDTALVVSLSPWYAVFKGDTVQGSKVKLIIESTETIGGEGEDKDDPKYSFELIFTVSRAITGRDVEFDAEDGFIELPLGTSRTYQLSFKDAFLDTTGPEQLEVYLVKGDWRITSSIIDSDVIVDRANETISVTLTSGVDDRYEVIISSLINAEDIEAVLYDKNDESRTPIDSVKVYVTDDIVKNTDLSDLSLTAGADSLTIDFTKLPVDEEFKSVDGLYYLVDVSANGESDQLVSFKGDILVPVTADTYTIVVANDNETYIADTMEYAVKVSLVQATDTGDRLWDGTDWHLRYDSDYAVCMGRVFVKTVSTLPNGRYATKVEVKKEKSVSKLYSTMGRIKIAEVVYDGNKGPANLVKRLKDVDLYDEKGKFVYGDNGNGLEIVGNAIYIDPEEAELLGKYTIVAYSVQPEGRDVVGKLKIEILQGIEDVSVKYPGTVVVDSKKKATIKPAIFYNVHSDNKPATKKLAWSFVDYYNLDCGSASVGNKIDFGKDITIDKKGVITVKKGYQLPDEGLELNVFAEAMDHEGNKAASVTTILLTNAPEEIESLYVYSHSQNRSVEIVEGASYYTAELYGQVYCHDADHNGVDADYTFSKIKSDKNEVGDVTVYADQFTKKASITATSMDGSKNKKKVEFSVVTDTGLRYSIFGANGRSVVEDRMSDYNYTNDRASGNSLFITVYGENESLIDHKIKLTGAAKKVLSSGKLSSYGYTYGTTYQITPNAKESVITLTDSVTKAEYTIKIENVLIGSGDKTSVTASNKYIDSVDLKKGKKTEKDLKGSILAHLYFRDEETYKAAGSINKVTYTVKLGKKAASGKVVVDVGDSLILGNLFQSRLNYVDPTAATPDTKYSYPDNRFVVNLDENGSFSIDYSDWYSSYIAHNGTARLTSSGYIFDIPKGDYSFTVTPIDENGKATAKSATVKFKAIDTPKASVKLKANVKNFESEGSIEITGYSNVIFYPSNSDEHYAYEPIYFKFYDLCGENKKGTISRFASVFSIDKTPNITSDKTFASLIYCVEDPKGYDAAYTAKPANGLTGYVEYVYRNLDGTEGTGELKITVKPQKKGAIVPISDPDA